MTPGTLLPQWLASALPPERFAWLQDSVHRVCEAQRDADLYLAFSLAARKTGRQPLVLTGQDLEAADQARPGWCPLGLTVEQAARLYLLLATLADVDVFERRLNQLCVTADATEIVTLYRGLPLYPQPGRYRLRAAEGLRSSMKPVFEAIAHHNPYAAEQLPEAAWNQMVLKALFIGSALDPIAGLDQRANPRLARMLCDHAHERWAAHRPVNPELWRCVGPFADADALTDLARALQTGTPYEQAGAALALHACRLPEAAALLQRHRGLLFAIRNGSLDWSTLAATN
ncbi:MAG: EboA domain-containing protein [Sphaerotilus sp.]|nr:EboA domain-containing protein [Sphaerotilus sp.]